MKKNIFDAASSADLATVNSLLSHRVDLKLYNEHGFTALHCAVMACDSFRESHTIPVIEALIQAGSPIEAKTEDGRSRTPLYVAAEFSQTLGPVKVLLAHGANPNVQDSAGNHIVLNAWTDEIKILLSEITGFAIPSEPLELPCIPLTAKEWQAVKNQLVPVFDALSQQGLIILHDAGTTQEDGFDDCLEIYTKRGGMKSGLKGFCFYSRQDLNRAKRSSQLPLSFWGAPDGNSVSTLDVGQQIVDAFRQAGFLVDWDNCQTLRPTVYLQDIGKNG